MPSRGKPHCPVSHIREKCGHRIVAKIASLSFCCRGIDTAGRFGGNELLLSYRKTNAEAAQGVGRCIRERVANDGKRTKAFHQCRRCCLSPQRRNNREHLVLVRLGDVLHEAAKGSARLALPDAPPPYYLSKGGSVETSLPPKRTELTDGSPATLFRMELFQIHTSPHNVQMRTPNLTSKQLFSVDRPACGAAAGDRCRLHSGFQPSEPHLDRKLSAIEILENKKILDTDRRAARKYLFTKLG
jgi:hypothetical protein